MNLPRLLFIISLVFFLIRNITLSLAMPIWSHGDEMAHVDYILKVGRGNIPTASEQIEPELFQFHREYGVLPSHTSDRESHTSRANIKDIRGLGYGGYSYQSKHPPLAYFIFALFQKLFQFLGLSLLIQIKLLRLISLAVVLLGCAYLFEYTKKRDK